MNQSWKIIVAVVITAVVVGGGVYFWQQNKEEAAPQITQKTETQVPAPGLTTKTEKIFEGDGFSFVYPVKYIADNKGLWTEEGYKNHINPPEICSTCHIPQIAVGVTTSNQSLEQYIIARNELPGKTLEEVSQQTDVIKYERTKIGDNDFIKTEMNDMFNVTSYLTKHNDKIVVFIVYWDEDDNKELRDIITTLKFK